ncbi:MAG: FHA domain-containing protein [Planctomycetota bacterium]|nr:FHA domain-containing protein [Planctomycetota bacterium]
MKSQDLPSSETPTPIQRNLTRATARIRKSAGAGSAGPLPMAAFLALHRNHSEQMFLTTFRGPFLVCHSGQKEPWLIDLGAFKRVVFRPLIIGRDLNCHIVFKNDEVSRQHASFEIVNGRWAVRDLGASNGTFIDKARIPAKQHRPLVDHSLLHFGRVNQAQFLSAKAFFKKFIADDSAKATPAPKGDPRAYLAYHSQNKIGSVNLDTFARRCAGVTLQEFIELFPHPVIMRLQGNLSGSFKLASKLSSETNKFYVRTRANEFKKAVFWILHTEFREKPFRLGRNPSNNELIVEEPDVSRHHSEIRFENDRWAVYDLQSSAGTKVNGHPLESKRELLDEAIIVLGDACMLQFVNPTSFYLFLETYYRSMGE